MVAYTLSQLLNNGSQNTTQDSNYITEIALEINGIVELSESTFPADFKIFDQYQQKSPGIIVTFKPSKYKCYYFRGRSNKISIL